MLALRHTVLTHSGIHGGGHGRTWHFSPGVTVSRHGGPGCQTGARRRHHSLLGGALYLMHWLVPGLRLSQQLCEKLGLRLLCFLCSLHLLLCSLHPLLHLLLHLHLQ